MTEIIVRPLEAHEESSWDAFVRNCGMGSLFHTTIWKSVINAAYDDGVYTIFGAFDNNRLVGGFCALLRNRLGVATAVMPLCTPYAGFIAPTSGEEKKNFAEGHSLTVLSSYLRNFRYQNLQCAPGLTGLQHLVSSGYHMTPRRTLELDLQQPEEKLWTGFSGQVRRNIKKAEKSGFEISNRWNGEQGYEIFRETFARHGEKCPVPKKLFLEIAGGDALTGNRRRYCAWRDGVMDSFLVALRYNGQVYYELAATNTPALKSGISSLLVWQILKDHLDGNWEVFDFVGANTPSITRFKEGFNPVVRSYNAVYCCTSKRIDLALKAQRLIRVW